MPEEIFRTFEDYRTCNKCTYNDVCQNMGSPTIKYKMVGPIAIRLSDCIEKERFMEMYEERGKSDIGKINDYLGDYRPPLTPIMI